VPAPQVGRGSEPAFMVNFRVSDLDAMPAQLRSGWAVDPEGTRFELWEPPPGH